MKGVPPLLIIFQRTLKAAAFWLLRLPRVADWLRLITQADIPKQKIFDLHISDERAINPLTTPKAYVQSICLLML
jgi:hypothetical protein